MIPKRGLAMTMGNLAPDPPVAAGPELHPVTNQPQTPSIFRIDLKTFDKHLPYGAVRGKPVENCTEIEQQERTHLVTQIREILYPHDFWSCFPETRPPITGDPLECDNTILYNLLLSILLSQFVQRLGGETSVEYIRDPSQPTPHRVWGQYGLVYLGYIPHEYIRLQTQYGAEKERKQELALQKQREREA